MLKDISNIEPKSDIIQKMKEKLDEFDRFNSIPPSIIIQFQVLNEAEYSSDFHLQIRNEKILRIFDYITIKDGELKLKEEKSKEIFFEIYGSNSLNLLEEIFQILNQSGILCIQRLDDRSKENHNKIHLRTEKKCNCKKCLYFRFEFNTLLKEIEKEVPFHIFQEDFKSGRTFLREALVNLRLGIIENSFYWLDEFRRKGVEEGNPNIVFLAENNIKQLLRFTDLLENSDNEKNLILEKIQTINLEETVIDSRQSQEIKKFKFDTISQRWLHTARRKIDEYSREIKGIRKLYDRKGNHSGPNHINNLLNEFKLLFLFYEGNSLFDTFFNRDYERVTNTTWEAILNSLATSDRYNLKLEKVEYFFVKQAIFTLSNPDLKKLFKESGINSFLLSEKNEKDFLKEATNFFHSNFQVIRTLGERIERDSFYHYMQDKRFFFRIEMRKMSVNFLFFLKHISFIEEIADLKKLIDIILQNFEFNEFLSHTEVEALNNFLCNKIDYWSDQQIERYFTLSFEKKFENIRSLSKPIKAIVNTREYVINNELLIKNIFDILNKKYPDSNKYSELILFYPIVTEDYKIDIRKHISSHLKSISTPTHHDFHLYQDAIFGGIIRPNFSTDFLRKYQYDLLTNFSRLEHEIEFFDHGIHYKNSVISTNSIYNFLKINALFGFPEKMIEEILLSTDLPNLVRWMLAPEKFDFNSFNPLWLHLFAYPDVYKNKSIDKRAEKMVLMFLKNQYNPRIAEILFRLS